MLFYLYISIISIYCTTEQWTVTTELIFMVGGLPFAVTDASSAKAEAGTPGAAFSLDATPTTALDSPTVKALPALLVVVAVVPCIDTSSATAEADTGKATFRACQARARAMAASTAKARLPPQPVGFTRVTAGTGPVQAPFHSFRDIFRCFLFHRHGRGVCQNVDEQSREEKKR